MSWSWKLSTLRAPLNMVMQDPMSHAITADEGIEETCDLAYGRIAEAAGRWMTDRLSEQYRMLCEHPPQDEADMTCSQPEHERRDAVIAAWESMKCIWLIEPDTKQKYLNASCMVDMGNKVGIQYCLGSVEEILV